MTTYIEGFFDTLGAAAKLRQPFLHLAGFFSDIFPLFMHCAKNAQNRNLVLYFSKVMKYNAGS